MSQALSANLNPTSGGSTLDGGGTIHDRAISSIQKAEIEIIVEYGRARFPEIPGVLYKAPNGLLLPSFLRVGNIQRSRAAVDAIFFWLLPHLRGCSGIITDTWSIGSIALNASRRLTSYQVSVHRPCPVEMVSSYLDGSHERAVEAADHIERILRLTTTIDNTAEDAPKVIFLMSAISTGQFHERIKMLLAQREAAVESVNFVSLFNLGRGTTPVPCLLDWSNGPFAPVAPLTITGPNETSIQTIEIDSQTYFLSSQVDVPHQVRERDVKEIRAFLDSYSDISPLRVHRTVTGDGEDRHHAIWIDTAALCGHPTFKERFIAKLTKLKPTPKLIITPVHEAAKSLATTAIEVLRNMEPAVEHVTHSDLMLNDDKLVNNQRILDLINGLDDRSAILILDDAFITGLRLIQYQRALRHTVFRGRVNYLVAVARPPSISVWRDRCKTLADKSNYISAIEEFVLPNWGEGECPWCNERRIYQAASKRVGWSGLTPALRERRKLLEESTHDGLCDNLFLIPPSIVSLSFTRGSKFAAHGTNQASVFVSVASGLQSLRSPENQTRIGKPALGQRLYPVVTVLNHSDYLIGTYTDSLLRACFLRAARDYELVYSNPMTEKEKTEAAKKLLTTPSQIDHDLSAEIIIAALAQKFPELKLAELPQRQAFARLGLTDMFGDLLESAGTAGVSQVPVSSKQ